MDIYAENILEHYKNPQNKGTIEDADIIQTGANPLCGDHIALYLKHDGEKITEVTFEGKGCAISQASASMMTEELEKLSLKEAGEITKEDILKMIGVELGPSRIKCALLIWDTLREALKTIDRNES